MSDSPSIWSRLRGLFRGNKPPPAVPVPVSEAAPPVESRPTPQVTQPQPPPPAPAALETARGKAPTPTPSPRVTTVAAPAVDLVLGLDLGTSCSKVVIGDPGWKNKSYAVSFGNPDGDISAWLHPTRFGSE